jgi:hypothetical protein
MMLQFELKALNLYQIKRVESESRQSEAAEQGKGDKRGEGGVLRDDVEADDDGDQEERFEPAFRRQ